MAPSHTISSHLCKQIYASWRQNKSGQPQANNANPTGSSHFARASSPEKRSMDSDRSDTSASSSAGSPPMSRQSSSSSWTRFGGR